MGVTMKKAILSFLILIPLSIAGLAIYAMRSYNIEHIVICATDDKTTYIPSSVCESFLLNFRLNEEDVKYFESRSGLSFLFEIQNKNMKYKLIKYFISKGVSVNKASAIDGYPPLHAAIINNDNNLVTFLLNNGADIHQKDTSHNLAPNEFVELLIQKQPTINRSPIKKIISSHKR